MRDLIDRLKTAWTLLSNDGDEYGLCDTLREAAAALEAAREEIEATRAESDRWRDRYRAAIDQARGKGVSG